MQRYFMENLPLAEALNIRPGVTALVGGGGKTSAMLRLAMELSARGSVVVTTTTHIFPPETMPVLRAPDASEIRAALAQTSAVCVGTPAPNGKLSASDVTVAALCGLSDYVLVEADGARGLPLKAPAGHEPVIPENVDCVVAVAGLSGVGKQIRETAFRPERYAALLGTDTAHFVAPEDVAQVLCSDLGQHKGVRAGMRFCVLLNQADDAARVEYARAVCDFLDPQVVERAVIARLKEF